MEQETMDQIMESQVKGTHQQKIQLFQIVKTGKLLVGQIIELICQHLIINQGS